MATLDVILDAPPQEQVLVLKKGSWKTIDLPPEIGTVIVRDPGLRCLFGGVLFLGRVAQAATQRRA